MRLSPGTLVVQREAAARAKAAAPAADRAAVGDLEASLRARVEGLERDLKRARRALAAERFAREALASRLRDEESKYHFAVHTLCRKAFPGEPLP